MNAGAAVVFMCVYCLPYHIGKPAGGNLSPATLAVSCTTVSSFLLYSHIVVSLLASLAQTFKYQGQQDLELGKHVQYELVSTSQSRSATLN